jgi:6-phosphogluconolactonase
VTFRRKQGERMGTKFGFLCSVLILLALGMTSCGTTSTTASSSGILYASVQGNPSVSGISAFGIDLTTGVLSLSNYGVKTGNKPAGIVATSTAMFVANSQDNTVSSYTVNADGTLTPATASAPAGATPLGIAVDPAGKFLYVVNQGTFSDPTSGSISVFSIASGATLTAVGSPVSTATTGVSVGTGPVSVAVSPNGNYLYVANQFTGTVSGYSISAGVLTLAPGSPYTVGTAPSAVAFSADGNFLFVANTGTNSIGAFAACTNKVLTCVTPDGHLTAVAGSPFPAGLGPVAITVVADSQDEYLFAVDQASNQISQYKVGVGTGVLTAASSAVSTGAGPVAIVVRAGAGTILADGGMTNYVYVANTVAGTISAFSYDTTIGTLTVVGSAVTTAGAPSGVLAK